MEGAPPRVARRAVVTSQPGPRRFSVLEEGNGTGTGADPINDGVNLGGVSPELDMLPMGATRNTWPNIVRNKKNVIFCATQFAYIDNRERCIQDFVKGPLLD